MPHIDANITDHMTTEQVAAMLHEEEVIEELIHQSEALKDEAEQIRQRANAIVRLLSRVRGDIGRSLDDPND